MSNSIFSSFSNGVDINRKLCAFLQIMPKFTGKYVRAYQKEDNSWDVLPQQNNFLLRKSNPTTTNHLCVENFSLQRSSLKGFPMHINEDVVDPVASLLLQRKTLEYFSDPNVHDRVYSSGLKII